jgi:putative redox protein
MNAKVTWQNNLTFTGEADTGYSVPLGASKEVGGDEDGFRPMELIATGLAGCTAMDTISILQKKRQDITAFEVHVSGDRAEEHPRVFTHIVIDYQITGHGVDEKAVKRAIQLSAERYCPAQGMLSQVVPIELKYQIFEARENQEPELIKSGEVNEHDN